MVEAHLFNPGGRWKYEVWLDYSEYDESGPYVDPHDAARDALRRSTRNGTSGVVIEELEDYWTMFVAEPPNGWPLMVKGT